MIRGSALSSCALLLAATLSCTAAAVGQSTSPGADQSGLIRDPLDLTIVQLNGDESFGRFEVTGNGANAGTWFTLIGRVVCDDPEYFLRYGADGSREFLRAPAPYSVSSLGFSGDYSAMPEIEVGIETPLLFLQIATIQQPDPPSVYTVGQPLLRSESTPNKLRQLFTTDYSRWDGAVENFWATAATDQGLDPDYLTWDAYGKSLILLQGAPSGLTTDFFNSLEFKELLIEFGLRLIVQAIGLQSSTLVPNQFPTMDDPNDPFGPGGLDLPAAPTISVSNCVARPLGGHSLSLPILTHPRPIEFGPTQTPIGAVVDGGSVQPIRVANATPGSSAFLLFADGRTRWAPLTITGPHEVTLRIPMDTPPGSVWITGYDGLAGRTDFRANNRIGFEIPDVPPMTVPGGM